MNDSTENTNELDSYGVWVKNTPGDDVVDMPSEDSTLESTDNLDFSDALDLPDFDTDTDFASSDLDDIFNETNPLSDEAPLSQDDETTLNSDELLNITNSVDLIETENSIDDDFNFDNFDSNTSVEESPVIEDSFNFDESLNLNDTEIQEEAAIDDSLSLEDAPVFEDDFTLDDTISTEENTAIDEDLSFDNSFISEETPLVEESFDFDSALSQDEAPVEEESLSIDDAFSLDEPAVEESIVEETPIVDTPVFEETPVTEETIAEEPMFSEDLGVISSGDEEISLDDFMDGGFSDESVAAGNNGYEPGNPNSPSAIPSSSASEEISLDDFIEGGFEVDNQKEEEIVDEKPLEMDISFDSSADTVKTEANFSIDTDMYDEDIEEDDDVSAVEESSSEVSSSVSSSENFEAEEIDLSDFGIDANAEETPVTQDIEASKVKEQVIDYDLAVENDNAVAAPIVNEIRSSENTESVSENAAIQAEPVVTAAAPAVDMSLLQQIVSELSSLKDEINTLKSNLNEMKTKESEEPVVSEDLGIVEAKDEGGFFSSDDTDDTIALSTDELTNIMTTASVNEVVQEGETINTAETLDVDIVDEPTDTQVSVENDIETETEVIENAGFDSIEETAVSEDELGITSTADSDFTMNYTEEKLEEPALDDTFNEVSSEYEDDDLPQEIDIEKDDILVESSTSDFMDSVSETSEPTIADQSLSSVGFMEENNSFISNPLEDFSSVSDESEVLVEEPESIEDNTPEEITFTDVFEETTSETTNDDIFNIVSEEPVLDESIIENSEPVLEETFVTESEPVIENSIDETDNFFATTDTIESPVEEIVHEENIDTESTFDDSFASVNEINTPVDETIQEEISVSEPSFEDSFATVDEIETPIEEEVFETTETIETPVEDDVFATTDTIEAPIEDEVFATTDAIETPVEDDVFATAETIETPVEDDVFATAETIETPVEDEFTATGSFEPVVTEIEEPIIEETSADENLFVTENTKTELTDTNINYLTSDETIPAEMAQSEENAELKKDIKSVLLYMDQLLENLPEDKIVEFAKSEEFTTYKKLFSELGLN